LELGVAQFPRASRPDIAVLRRMSPEVALIDDYAMSALTVAIWGKPDQICSMSDFLEMTRTGLNPKRCARCEFFRPALLAVVLTAEHRGMIPCEFGEGTRRPAG
jgi:hypothetical protein